VCDALATLIHVEAAAGADPQAAIRGNVQRADRAAGDFFRREDAACFSRPKLEQAPLCGDPEGVVLDSDIGQAAREVPSHLLPTFALTLPESVGTAREEATGG
jgi:hypothetical protein